MESGRKKNQGVNGKWTKTEHERFLKGLERYGRDWVSVQKIVKSRSLIQVRSHAQKFFMKMNPSQIQTLFGKESEYEEFEKSKRKQTKSLVKPTLMLPEEQKIQQNSCYGIVKPEDNWVDLFLKAIQELKENEEGDVRKNDEAVSEKMEMSQNEKETFLQHENWQSLASL